MRDGSDRHRFANLDALRDGKPIRVGAREEKSFEVARECRSVKSTASDPMIIRQEFQRPADCRPAPVTELAFDPAASIRCEPVQPGSPSYET
jgi:hypothetical protein